MTVAELRAKVAEAVLAGRSDVILVIPRGLSGFPRGELLQVKADGSSVRAIECWRILRKLDQADGVEP